MPNKNISLTKIILSFTFYTHASSIFFATMLHAENNVETLSGVKTEISRQEQLLVNRNKKLNELQIELKNQDQDIGVLISDIRDLDASIQTMNANIYKIQTDNQRLERQKQIQIEQLKALLISQYKQGKHGSLSAILTGKADELERISHYAQKLSKQRSHIINQLEQTSTTLQAQRMTLNEQRDQTLSMLSKLNADKETLLQTQLAKKETTKQILQQISNNKIYLAELKDNERKLTQAVEKAKLAQAKREEQARLLANQQAEEKARKEVLQAAKQEIKPIEEPKPIAVIPPAISMAGIGKSKGKLNWPVKGKLLHRFGSQQSGQLRWHGVVISAQSGSEVEAIHDGTVVLSNWLRGYGLMLVIDHGKGDMSFYGYNQTLLRKVGDKVRAGETIALVGNSGGQASSGLYFEIRRKGHAINPAPWLQR